MSTIIRRTRVLGRVVGTNWGEKTLGTEHMKNVIKDMKLSEQAPVELVNTTLPVKK